MRLSGRGAARLSIYRTPALAARIANCFVENMGRLVHSRSHQRRQFIEDQLALRRRELAHAEEALRDFQHLNRSIALQKEAEEQVKALVELATERESARIALLVDAAVPPEKPVFPNKPLNALLGALAGAALGLLAGRRRA